MPLNTKIGRPVKCGKVQKTIRLTNDQAQHMYKKLESEGIVKVDTIKQEIEEDKLGGNNINDDEVNSYNEIITNNIDKVLIITLQVEKWSILSNIFNYVQYDRHHRNFMI